MKYLQFVKELKTEEKWITGGMIITFLLFGPGDLMPLVGLLIMTVGIVKAIHNKGYREVLVNPLSKPFLLLVLVSIASLIRVVDLRSTINMMGTLLEVVIGFFVSFYLFKNKGEKFNKKMMTVLLIGGGVTAFYGLYLKIVYSPPRLGSIISNPNLLGYHMMFLFFLSISLWYREELKYKILGSGLIIIFAYNIFFTLSKSAILGTVTGLIFYFYHRSKKLMAIFLVFIVLFIFFLPAPLMNRVESAVDRIREGEYIRIYIYRDALRMFKENPLLGVGIGHFREYYTPPPEVSQKRYNHAHNIFLQIMADLGAAGLVAFIYLIISIIKIYSLAFPFSRTYRGALSLLFSSAFVACFVQEQTEFSISSSASAVLTAIFLGWFMALLSGEIKAK